MADEKVGCWSCRCWHCNSTEGEVKHYAYPEDPTKHVLSLHPECVKAIGVGGELILTK